MTLIPFFRFLSLLLVLPAGIVNAQSLADVLSSIQERKLVLEQAQALRQDQVDFNPYYPGGKANTFELIDWTETPQFPVDDDLADATIERRVRLLNEAAHHFATIRVGYLNMDAKRLDGTSGSQPPAVIRRFDEFSLPTPAVANQLNYQIVLRDLASKVDALRVTSWPMDYVRTTKTIDDSYPDKPQSSGADKIRWSELNVDSTGTRSYWAPENPVEASYGVNGKNFLFNKGTEASPNWQPQEYRKGERVWPSEFELKYAPPGLSLPPEVSAVEGRCVVLSKLRYSPYLGASTTGASETPVPKVGGYKIIASRDTEGTQTLAAPEWTVSGTWTAAPESNDSFHKNFQRFHPTLAAGLKYDRYFEPSWEGLCYRCIAQEIVFVLVPSFSKGMDKATIDYAWDRLRVPGEPGVLSVSGGASKISVDAGRGESMYSSGFVGIPHAWMQYWGWGWVAPAPMAYPTMLWGHSTESIEYLDYFTDLKNHHEMPLTFGSNLKFNGPERDFQVIYETRFGDGRSSLKDWPELTFAYRGGGWEHGMGYYWEWEQPRLRQVLGREALIDINVGANDYTHVISVYRIPEGHVISYNADGFVIVNGLLHLKDITISNPSVLGGTNFPTDPLVAKVAGDNGDWSIEGSEDFMGYPSNWDIKLKKSGTEEEVIHEVWEAVTGFDEIDDLTGNPVGYEAPVIDELEVTRTIDGVEQGTFTRVYDQEYSLAMAAMPRVVESSVESTDAAATTTYAYSGDLRFPTTITSNASGEPETILQIGDSGLPISYQKGSGSGQWRIEWDMLQAGRLLETSSLGGTGSVVGRKWTAWANEGKHVTVHSAPDGTVSDFDSELVDWTTTEYGAAGGTGFPCLPNKLTRKDGSGATWAWTIHAAGSTVVDAREGMLTSGAVTKGTRTVSSTNTRGYPTGTESYFIHGQSEVKTGGTATPNGQFSAWGAPLKALDFSTQLAATWEFDENRERLASSSDALGVDSVFSTYDALDRLTDFTWDGKTGSLTHHAGGLGVSSTLNIPGHTNESSRTWDAFGRTLEVSETAGGTSTCALSRTNGDKTITLSDSVTGEDAATTIGQSDGSLISIEGSVLPFQGKDGTTPTVDGGLLKASTHLKGVSGAALTTWTDAWGRPRRIQTPNGTTDVLHNLPSSTFRRVRINEPSGRKLITESDPYDATGSIHRSGIDVDGSGTLGGSDRYVESTTTATGGKIRTTVKTTDEAGPGVNGGLREILRTEWEPSGNETTTILNGGEETITRTPHYGNKTVTTQSSKGWTKTSSLNSLGLTSTSTLAGTDIPASTLNPTWRADGTLEGISLSIGGATHSATFNGDSTIATLTGPDGNIPVSHSFSGGLETLVVNGVTTQRTLDGTQVSSSGGEAVGKTDTLAANADSSGFEKTVHPATGADTVLSYNTAGAPTGKAYAAGTGHSYTHYPGGLLHTVSMERATGGTLEFGYSSDGAKDLTSATWPAITSGVFNIPAVTLGYGRDSAGRVATISDASGARSIVHENGRLKQTTWNTGALAGYKVVRSQDVLGRDSGYSLYRGNSVIHSATKIPNGVSGEVSEIICGSLKIVPGRNGMRQITGYQWGNASGTFNAAVSQSWQRGAGGRIEAAGSDVAGAPSFTYLIDPQNPGQSFDTRSRRLKCSTAGGEWTYDYTAGQLTGAVHPTLGSFSYSFDGIGRRTENAANTSDLLNRTLGWTNSQNKTLKISAHPDARVWVNGTEVQNFNGNVSYAVQLPQGQQSGWMPWQTRAVLEGEGDPGAHADAEAEQSGAVWVPPVSENLSYDADGNRQDSALWDYGWNARNQLVRARTKGYNTAPQGYDLTFDYDSEGRRFKKKVMRWQNGTIVEQKVITFIHDGNDLIYERHQYPGGLTTLERKYVWGPDLSGSQGGAGGAGGLLLTRETKGNTTIELYPLYDGTGHVVGLSDSGGNLQAEYAYGPFGESIHAKGSAASANPWRYATKYLDAETGLYYFGQRYLDPITGQWLSREPLGEGESVNLYSYAHNDPINQVDRLGLEAVPVDATLNNGIPSMIYEEWAGSGLAYMWNALAAGKVKSWIQSPDEGQIRRCFYFEEGRWHLRSPEARHNAHTAEAIAAIPAKMEEIKPIMDFCERGGAIAAALPLVAAAGSAEVGAAVYVYGGHAMNSFAVKSGLALLGTQAAFEFATDESVRNETIAAIASDPNGVRATGELLAAGAGGLARMGPRAASLWDTVADGLFPSYGARQGFAPGGVLNPFAAKTTVLGENMAQRGMPFAEQTGARTLGFGSTADEWAAMTAQQRYKLNDGMLRARINEGDSFRYIGQDPMRNPALRTQFDLTGSELLRLNSRGIPYETVSPSKVMSVIGRP